ncbi:MAG: biopolymer transporter ExbD [Planctomycetes bacterium]|nr:biopolymer transporter ExbD [Planctomycetota bacterium]
MAKKKKPAPEKSRSAEAKMDMTPMIDVTFLLLVFFLCATKFKQLERRLDAFLPKDVGPAAAPAEPLENLVVRVDTVGEGENARPRISVAGTTLPVSYNPASPDAFWNALGQKLYSLKDKPFPKTEIDAGDKCVWEFVALTLDQCIAAKLKGITFAAKP